MAVTQSNRNYVKTPHGYSAESLPLVETISPHMRKNIIEGKDVNLAALLIPYYSGPMNNDDRLSVDSCHNRKPDPRLNRNLSLNEFMKAFGIYKNVMCQAYPSRREELDMYERDIVDMGYEYGGKGFYEYHKIFSSQAAAYLRYHNIKVDWSVRNNRLFCNVFVNHKPNSVPHTQQASALNCCKTGLMMYTERLQTLDLTKRWTYMTFTERLQTLDLTMNQIGVALCQSTTHSAGFCPQLLQNRSNDVYREASNIGFNKEVDIHGRTRHLVQGNEICNNFNRDKGCFRANCLRAHICLNCHKAHSQINCYLNKDSSTSNHARSQPKNLKLLRNRSQKN